MKPVQLGKWKRAVTRSGRMSVVNWTRLCCPHCGDDTRTAGLRLLQTYFRVYINYTVSVKHNKLYYYIRVFWATCFASYRVIFTPFKN